MTFLPGLQGEAAAGKMADGKAGEEKPEKPQRAGAVGGEHYPSVAGYGGYSGLSLGFPGWGALRHRWSGRSWRSPGQGLGPDECRARPVGPAGDRGPRRLIREAASYLRAVRREVGD